MKSIGEAQLKFDGSGNQKSSYGWYIDTVTEPKENSVRKEWQMNQNNRSNMAFSMLTCNDFGCGLVVTLSEDQRHMASVTCIKCSKLI